MIAKHDHTNLICPRMHPIFYADKTEKNWEGGKEGDCVEEKGF